MMLGWAKESIDWVLEHEYYFDTLGLLSYSLVSCATILYHASVRRGDKVALEKLQLLRDYFKRTTEKREGSEDSVFAKSGAVIALLCDASMGAFPSERYTGALNPTAGVSNRKTAEAVSGLKFKPDPTRPGGGVYVADTTDVVIHDLPRGTVVLKEPDNSNRMPVYTQSPNSGAWQMVSGNRDSVSLPAMDPTANPGAKLVTMFPMATGLANFGEPSPGPQVAGFGAPRRESLSTSMGFNVNPHLNDTAWNPAANFVFESSADLAPNLQGPGVDPLLLGELSHHGVASPSTVLTMIFQTAFLNI